MNYCKHCGSEIPKGRKFCSRECFQMHMKGAKSDKVVRKEPTPAQPLDEAPKRPIKDNDWCWCEGYQELIRASHCRRRRGGLIPMAPWIKKYCYSCKGRQLRLMTEAEIEKHKNAPDQGDRRRGKIAGV